MKKIIVTGAEARKKILAGVEKVDQIVGSTIGPAGRNYMLQQKYRAPLISNDGVTVARHIVLDDPIEDLGAQTVVEAAIKTNETAGDGTSTAVVLASAIVRECFSRLSEEEGLVVGGGNVMKLFRQIMDDGKKATALIENAAKKLEDGDLMKVITTSLEDEEMAKMLAEIVLKLGKDAHISVTDNWATKYGIETDVITGFRDYGTYATPYLVSNDHREAVWEDTPVLVTNHQFQDITILFPLLQQLKDKGVNKVAVFSSGDGKTPFEDTALKQVIANTRAAVKGDIKGMKILAVKTPSMTSEQLTDLATFTGAMFFDHKAGVQIVSAKLEHLGKADKIVVNEDEFVVIGGAGDTTARVSKLTAELETEKDQMFKEKIKRRIGSLSAGVGIIRVGAPTESEREYLRLKLEDAVNAAKAALEEGTVKGGGLLLKEIAEKLGPDSILYNPLQEPYKRIQKNAGGTLEISDAILDPAKVERLAVVNACSAAGALITVESALAYPEPSVWDEMAKKMGAWLDNGDSDYRSAHNQERGIGRVIK